MNFYKNIALLFFILWGKNLVAQQPVFKNYNKEDGLPGSEVYSVYSDKKGYIWVGTDAGVSRYDGKNFENFDINDGLSENAVYEITEDSTGHVWFVSRNTFSYFSGGKIYTLPVNEYLKKQIPVARINSLYIDKDAVIYFPGWNFDYISIAPPYGANNVKVHPYPAYTSNYIKTFGKKGLIFGSGKTDKTGLTILSDRPQFTGVPVDNKKFVHQCCIQLRSGDLLYANKTLVKISGSKTTECNFKIKGHILALYEDWEQNTWVGTSDGVYYLKNGDFSNPKQYLLSEKVSKIIQDFEGGYWFSTASNGVFYLQNKVVLSIKRGEGIIGDDILSVSDCNGSILLSSNNTVGKLKGNKLVHLYPSQGTFDFILDDPADKCAIVSAGNTLVKLYPGTGKRVVLRQGFIKALALADRTHIWAGNDVKLELFSLKEKKASGTWNTGFKLTSLLQSADNRLWIGALDGLRYKQGNVIRRYAPGNAYFNSKIVDIKEDKEHNIWFAGKEKGVAVLKPGGEIEYYNKQSGLASNICKSVFIDENSNAWISTNSGINCIEYLGKKIKLYSVSDGLVSNDVHGLTMIRDTVIAATAKGVSFLPVNGKNTPVAPLIYITGFSMSDKALDKQQSQNLKYYENSLLIEYRGLSYKSGPQLTYKYRLNSTGYTYTRNNSVQIPFLNPGSYKFEVYAVNEQGIISKPVVLTFCIAPPFWKRMWFEFLAIIIIISLVVLIFFLNARNIRRKNDTQNKVLTHQLKALQSQMNPHFIFNCLNSIQLYIVRNDNVKSQKFLSKFAKLIRYVLEHSAFTLISLEDEIKALELYLELESMRLNDAFEYKINFEQGIDMENTRIPSMIIQPYIENALWHGFDSPSKNWKLEISFSVNDNMLRCIIKDNGIGRKKSMESKSHNFPHKSVGMSVTRERLEIINSLNNKPLKLKIEDLYDEQQQAAGTKIELNIPIN